MAYRFRALIERERDRFDTRENNLFAAAFNDVWVYRWFLDVVLGRYAPLGSQYEQALQAHWGESRISIGGPATSELLGHAHMSHLGLLARLEIETFYLLAGVLLERVATGLGFYFEGRTDNDWRHSGMTSEAFGPYADKHQPVSRSSSSTWRIHSKLRCLTSVINNRPRGQRQSHPGNGFVLAKGRASLSLPSTRRKRRWTQSVTLRRPTQSRRSAAKAWRVGHYPNCWRRSTHISPQLSS